MIYVLYWLKFQVKFFEGIDFFPFKFISEIVDYNGSNGWGSGKDTCYIVLRTRFSERENSASLFTTPLTFNIPQNTSDTR